MRSAARSHPAPARTRTRAPRPAPARPAPLILLTLLALVAGTSCTSATGSPEPTSAVEQQGTQNRTPPAAGTPTAFPTPESTGPRLAAGELRVVDSIASRRPGEVIEGLETTSQVTITHDDVVLRDVRINHDAAEPGQYALAIEPGANGTCPAGVVIEFIEIVGDARVLADDAKAVYGDCPFTLRYSTITGVGSAIRITNGAVIEGNYILADLHNPGSEAHRSGIGLNGGAGHVIVGNTITCAGPGCSGALVMYGTNAQVADVLVQANLLNTTGSYCTYAGSLESKPYPLARNVRYLNNTFGQEFHETCGRSGPVAGRTNGGGPGYVWEGNVWADSGEEVP